MRIRKKSGRARNLPRARFMCTSRKPPPEHGASALKAAAHPFRPRLRQMHVLAKLAHREKDVNFIGIDISEDILGVARRNIEAEFGEEPVENVNLLSYNIEKLDTLFAPDEKAARIYVNFCNPWQKAGDHKRRLTHTRQLNTYKKVLAPGGELWFKTDNTDLYLATQRYLAEAGFEILCKTDDLHSEDAPGNIQSEHEVMFTAEGIKTKAIIARWNGEPETPERVSTEQAEKVENTAE